MFAYANAVIFIGIIFVGTLTTCIVKSSLGDHFYVYLVYDVLTKQNRLGPYWGDSHPRQFQHPPQV